MDDALPPYEAKTVEALTLQSMKRSYEMFAATPIECLPVDAARSGRCEAFCVKVGI